jgi:hypothetical protein
MSAGREARYPDHEPKDVPELPDIAAYITALETRIVGQPLIGVSIAKPFVLRTTQPRPENASPSASTATTGWCFTS